MWEFTDSFDSHDKAQPEVSEDFVLRPGVQYARPPTGVFKMSQVGKMDTSPETSLGQSILRGFFVNLPFRIGPV
jgi:hypothetical protein